MRFFIFLICLVLAFALQAQDFSYNKTAFAFQKVGYVDLSKAEPVLTGSLESLEAPNPGGEGYRDYLEQIKTQIQKQFPRKSIRRYKNTTAAVSPTQGENFGASKLLRDSILVGSQYIQLNNGPINTGNPSDHTLGVSKDGMLMVGYNSSFWGKDLVADTLILNPDTINAAQSFGTFTQASGISLSFPFDPKILYDPEEDRFVLQFLSGRTPSDSKIIVAFSETNHPGKGWHIYEITGNPNSSNQWTDYPAFALTEDDLFITVNLLRANEPWQTGFAETIVWQIDKSTGYAGNDTLSTQLWNNITYNNEPLRYFRPFQGGSTLTGPNCYFLSNRSIPQLVDTIVLLNDSLFLIEITDALSSGNASLTVKAIKADNIYGTPPNAKQANGRTFNTNDSRVLGGFIENGEIQFVGNTLDTASGLAAIYHGFITDLSAAQPQCELRILTGKELNGEDLEIGYPNIAYAGINPGDRDAIIGVNHTSESNFAGNSCIYMNSAGEYSEQLILKEGVDYVNELGGLNERWGDYSGIQRNYANPKEAWMVGYYGSGNQENSLWVSQLMLPTVFASVEEGSFQESTKQEAVVYPNPVRQSYQAQVEFQVTEGSYLNFELFTIDGKSLGLVNRDFVKKGSYRYSIPTLGLSEGTYLLNIYSDDNSFSTSSRFVVKL